MLKILYAASNNYNAKIQLERFLHVIKKFPITLKIAAYKKSSPINTNIDWTLDSLLDIYGSSVINYYNEDFRLYYEQIKSYKPDLIISDLEDFTSYVAQFLNIKLWQCSSYMTRFAIPIKDIGINVNKYYSEFLNSNTLHNASIVNLINNSDRNYIYSHFGDCENSPNIKDGFEWIRPYHYLGDNSALEKYGFHIMGVSTDNTSSKKIITILKRYKHGRCNFFTNINPERHGYVKFHNTDDIVGYYNHLVNCDYLICDGQTSYLADAYYNGVCPYVFPIFDDADSLINSLYSEKLKLSINIFTARYFLGEDPLLKIIPSYKENIKYLHEKVEEEYALGS